MFAELTCELQVVAMVKCRDSDSELSWVSGL
jgi:hypothetical protein